MKSVLTWLKSNPLTVISVIVVLASIGVFVYFVGQSATLREEIEAFSQEPNKLARITRQSVELPPAELGAPVQNISGVTYNQATIDRLQEIYADVTQQANQTRDVITIRNRESKAPLINGMFPNTASIDPFQFRALYRDALSTLLGGPGPQAGFAEVTDITLPTLNAGLPPSEEELQQRLAVIVQEGLQTFGENITEGQAQNLREEQRARLLSTLKSRAQSLDIYADPLIGPPTQLNPGFPLSVRPWIFAGTTPEPRQLWESQMELWIQSDIVEALRRANRIDEVVVTAEDGTEITGNVLTGVAKRLIRLDIEPAYVGLHTTGRVGGDLDPSAAGQRGSVSRNTSASNRPAGPLPTPPDAAPVQPGAAVNANYFFAPTGRASNNVFDVRHVRLTLHADFQKLPDLYNAIGSTNYMTVIDQRIDSLDEFDFGMLGGPFLYGPGDMVQLELVIETLWLREWTAPWMPEDVRTYTGATDAAADAAF
ncbi:MAG: hypothetical protein AAGE65_13850 [Planctomycetota bacterium]